MKKLALFLYIIFFNISLKSHTVLGWGYNYYGQLGIGKDVSYEVPVKVLNMSNAVDISAGGTHSLGLKNNGTTWAWGSNDYGQLGNGEAKNNRNLAVKVWAIWDPYEWNPDELNNVKKVVGGVSYSLALKEDGTVWAWGRNLNGELGIGYDYPYLEYAFQVANIDNVIDIAAGGHSYAIKRDGTLWGWGANYFGQIGDGSYEDQDVPVQVKGIDNVKQVDVSGVFKPFSLALKNDGSVWAWGFNKYGELGNGTFEDSNLPVKVLNISAAKKISAGSVSLAIAPLKFKLEN